VGIGYQDPMDAGLDNMFAKGSNLQAVARDRLHAIDFEFPAMSRADGGRRWGRSFERRN
jgi:hypothetical protein